ncbi:hypothetical protein [Cellulomonas edaphi]|uniref:Uncharacterized protein n=1 Tax=Cellulomonas edaphi TaxID=3053468 RepID=A0ABT7S317_9CELL|nr:hypothetical protein [Cellulomons edaphi]MDM7830010.1 hypothetical protein [Cellulomons edaphi]
MWTDPLPHLLAALDELAEARRLLADAGSVPWAGPLAAPYRAGVDASSALVARVHRGTDELVVLVGCRP